MVGPRAGFPNRGSGSCKAQQVKNVVIVPTGSKGGFVPKYLSQASGRDEFMATGISAYREFIGNLLRLTDNLEGAKVIPPEDTVRFDGDDPYLVVAADKGTATFSDFANELSVAHSFWLGDAFASGGSAGYDHKKMAITARGGWEAVKRHFREMDWDIQSEPFRVIGVGDMSGDVFGNGMLLSNRPRLSPHSTIVISLSIPILILKRAGRNGNGFSTLGGRAGRTMPPRRSAAVAASSAVCPNQSN